MQENYFAAYVHLVVALGVKFQIPISAINAAILYTGFISTKIALQHDVKHGLYVTTFQCRFSKLKSTAHTT
jgi:Sec-independent protein secretion pathway component TatC